VETPMIFTTRAMKTNLVTILFIGLSFFASAQTIRLGDSLKITFLPMDKSISDSSRLYFAVAYENISRVPIPVYNKLVDGDLQDKFSNVVVSIERESAGHYLEQPTTFYNRNPNLVYADSLRHYDLPKSPLGSLVKDTLQFGLSRLTGDFDKGNYRIKITLRVNVVQNKTEYHNDPTGNTVPPEDEIQYISSDWIYFKILNRIQVSL
jgi:hypothetical protein